MIECSYCGKPLPDGAAECPHCRTRPSDGLGGAPVARSLYDTLVEHGGQAGAGYIPTRKEQTPSMDDSDTLEYRPRLRPPIASLKVLADGSRTDGETYWIREGTVVIGRTEGQIVIAHDPNISSRHAEVVRRNLDGKYTWHITDLDSKSGVFVRVRSHQLKNNDVFMIGQRLFRLDLASGAATQHQAVPMQTINNLGDFDPATSEPRSPELVEVRARGNGRRFALQDGDNWIGRDPQQPSLVTANQCGVVLTGDRTVSPRHANLFVDEDGEWTLEDAGSLNGVWVRVKNGKLDDQSEFQLGEQRFLLTIY